MVVDVLCEKDILVVFVGRCSFDWIFRLLFLLDRRRIVLPEDFVAIVVCGDSSSEDYSFASSSSI